MISLTERFHAGFLSFHLEQKVRLSSFKEPLVFIIGEILKIGSNLVSSNCRAAKTHLSKASFLTIQR